MTQDEDLDQLMAGDAVDTSDKLEILAKSVREWRDAKLEIQELEEKLEETKERVTNLERRTLPELFSQAGVDRVDVQPQGNFPGAEARLQPFYRAAIPVGWPQPQKEAAFRELTNLGLESIIKPTVTISFNRDELSAARRLVKEMEDRGIDAKLDQRVNHQTLTSSLKELCEDGKKPEAEVLNAIGATVGQIVKVKLL